MKAGIGKVFERDVLIFITKIIILKNKN